jgi:topoisomerase IV subunit A
MSDIKIDSKEFIKEKYKQYGVYINWSRAVPGWDGLKLVQRRILYSTHMVAASKFVKSTYVVSKAMLLHPHGDTSIFQTLVGLVQNGFVHGQGNWGNNYGLEKLEASASRYVECKENLEIPIKWDNLKFSNWKTIELENEPLYIPTSIPLSLIAKEPEIGIGMALKYSCPIFIQDEISRYSKELIKNMKMPEDIIYPELENHKIISDTESIIQLLNTGKGKIKYKGKYSVYNKDLKIILYTIPFNKKIDTLLKKLNDYIKTGHIEIIDMTTDRTRIEIQLINQRRLKFDKLIEIVDKYMEVNVTYNIVVYDYEKNQLQEISINNWILKNYQLFKESMIKQLKFNYDKWQEKLNEISLLIMIQKVLPKYMNNDIKYDTIIKNVSKDIKAPQDQVKDIFSKYTLEKILKAKIDKRSIIDKIKEINNHLENIDDYCLSFYK